MHNSVVGSRPTEPRPAGAKAWAMLALVTVGFVMMTLNWFNISTTFGNLATEFDVGIPSLALLISAFVVGYGLMHVPAGFLAAKIGLRTALAAGLVLQGVTAAGSGLARNYEQLLALRTVSGVGASVYAGLGIAAVSIWFVGRAHALALGLVSAAFSLGVAIGLYTWADLVAATDWRTALIIGGVLCIISGLAIAVFYRVPAGSRSLHGTALSGSEIRQILQNRNLWVFGLAFFGGYGAYFAASQLISSYAVDERGIDVGQANIASLVVGLAGIPGSILVGWLSDRLRQRTTFVIGQLLLMSAGLMLVPFIAPSWLWAAAFLIGFGFNGCFAVWQTVPGEDVSIPPHHIATAVGLMLTIAGVGGFVVPWAFGLLVPALGYTTAWVCLAAVSSACACIALATPRRATRPLDTPLTTSATL